MNNAISRPMPTPDLAGLLGKPRKRAVEVTPPANQDDQPARAGQPAVGSVSALSSVVVSAPARVLPASTSATPVTVAPDDAPAPKERNVTAASTTTAPVKSLLGQRRYLRSTTIYLPRSLHTKIAQHAADRGTTATTLILTAVKSAHGRVAAALASEVTPANNDLFDIPQDKSSAELSVQTTMRVTDQQFEALQTLAATLGITRSKLIVTATKLYLAPSISL